MTNLYDVRIRFGAIELNDVPGDTEEEAAEEAMLHIAQDVMPDLFKQAEVIVTLVEDEAPTSP